MSQRGSRKGFTLIELLVVIVIIAVLVGMLLPAVQKVREAANNSQCQNNLKQMGIALHKYHDTNGSFPAGFYPWWSGTFTYTGWQLQLLPNLEQDNLWKQSYAYLQGNAGNTDSNSYPACGFQEKTFICPSNIRPKTFVYAGVTYEVTSYMGNTGTSSNNPMTGDGVLYGSSQVTFASIQDGSSNTIAVGERPCTGDNYYGWGFAPYGTGEGDGDTVLGARDSALAVNMGDVATNVGFLPPSQPTGTGEIDGAHFWSFHFGGANFLFCDGSVHFLSYSANSVFPQLCTRNGGEAFDMP
jgi:prepilin-type N-terminal cleavage/methylation domain-containing protein/prepilin-type processing-associated H-X9-DG protein